MENELKEIKFIDKFIDDILYLKNNHYNGILKETFQDRGNNLLASSKKYLNENNNIPDEEKYNIKYLQYWIIGFLSGQHLIVHEENNIL